jgi:two-component system chemotaxis response regulator CheB
MPKMNGTDFLKSFLPQYPIPTIVVSSVSNIVFEAMSAGAVDFISKPDERVGINRNNFISELTAKIIVASLAKVSGRHAQPDRPGLFTGAGHSRGNLVIAIGASTGGTEALFSIIKQLPNTLPGIVVVQHIPPVFSKMFADRLNNLTPLAAKEAKTGDPVRPGEVLVAPGGFHMRLKRSGSGYSVECFSGEKLNGVCPSVDILFDSAAKEAGKKALGVILTGMGRDGANGLLAMRRAGARTLGQDEESSVVYGMPKAAFLLGAVEKQKRLEDIPSSIVSTVSAM